MKFIYLLASIGTLVSLSIGTFAFQIGNVQTKRQTSTSRLLHSGGPISRHQWLQNAVGSVATVMIVSPAAYAKDVDPALQGTKKDPQFEACLSQCVYGCTKPKGTEQKSRAQCLGECKKECAKTKTQMNALTPKDI